MLQIIPLYPIILLADNGVSFGTAGQYGGKHKMPDYEEKQEAKKFKLDEEVEGEMQKNYFQLIFLRSSGSPRKWFRFSSWVEFNLDIYK